MTREITKWDLRYLELCRFIAQWSKDPSTKVGAVIVRPDKTIASMGFNGFPKGVQDLEEHYTNRDFKYPRIVHAEANTIVHATESLGGYTIYVDPLLPCGTCAGLIIQSGIKEVISVTTADLELRERWSEQNKVSLGMFKDAGIEVYLL